jgi:hypothetical protein
MSTILPEVINLNVEYLDLTIRRLTDVNLELYEFVANLGA